MSDGRARYIHGTAPEEQRRLSRLNELINDASLSRLRIRPGQRILDLGCGIGQLTRAMAGAGAARVVGIEWSEAQIAEGARQGGTPAGVDIRQGDASDPPLTGDEWGTFDVVHTRFLLEHLPQPQRVVEVMVRAARPGARLVVEDDDHELLRLCPALPAFERIWRAYMDTYRASGCDPEIGRRLPRMLCDAGAQPVRVDWPFFGACHGAADWETIVSNCRAIVTGARDAILREGMDAAAFEAGLSDYDTWSDSPGAAFWYCTFWAEAVKPG